MARGSLFTQDFLERGIQETEAWRSLSDEDAAAYRERLRAILAKLPKRRQPNESQTEERVIWPVLAALGWQYTVQQKTDRSGRAIPDGLLFADAEAKARADEVADGSDEYRHGAAIVEAKRWQRELDRKSREGLDDLATPSSQILHYLNRVEVTTQGTLRWGILTNGRLWRLYFQGARSVAEDYFEIDLPVLLGMEGYAPELWDRNPDHLFKVFLLIFRPDAFRPSLPDGRTFLQYALDEGRNWEAAVTESLSNRIFGQVFPTLVESIVANDPDRPETLDADYLTSVKEGALVFLYRLLFIFYAEDRDLLPFRDSKYDDYSLRSVLKILDRLDRNDKLSAKLGREFYALKLLFRAVEEGDPSIGIPPYNGGLFAPARTPILERVEIPDRPLVEILDGLARETRRGEKLRINYHDLSVQHLGAIYERLLENEVVADADGKVRVVADERARKGSGAYYTTEPAVQLIIRNAVQPLLDDAWRRFRERAAELARESQRPAAYRLVELQEVDPAAAFLNLKICDPAMGSGHFLVSLVDYVSQAVLGAMEAAAAEVDWAGTDTPYVSPLAERIERMRAAILEAAKAGDWTGVTRERLDDRQLVRRMVLKRVVHGVDKNPMAVELAKVSLWLHTFTVGAPLSFLEHHLRVGDSICGEWVRAVNDRLNRHGHEMLLRRSIDRAAQAARAMKLVEDTTDTDIAEVRASSHHFQEVADRTQDLEAFLDFMHAVRASVEAHPKKKEREQRETALQQFLDGQYGDPIEVVGGRLELRLPEAEQTSMIETAEPQASFLDRTKGKADRAAAEWLRALLENARDQAAREHYLHWQPAFPGVWDRWTSVDGDGGFDAVIGNPPYVRGERLGAMKPVLQSLYDSFHGQADLYVYFFERGLQLLRPGGRLSYIVTNKWLRAGYAAPLRALLGERAWLESVYDFGHARQFFPAADVFPSIVTVRRPHSDAPAPEDSKVAVIPRDDVRLEDLADQVKAARFLLPRAGFTREAWRLEPPQVGALLDKIRANGVPLRQYAGCRPQYGIKTGLNEAFLIDTPTRDRLIAEDPNSADIIKPYLRGQDIDRWVPDWQGLWMILLKSSGDHPWPWADAKSEGEAEGIFARTYPGLHRHLAGFRERLHKRQDKGRFWWELRSCAYYETFESDKIMYQEIQYHPQFLLDDRGYLSNNKVFFIGLKDYILLSILNSPLMWWFNWRYLPHMKDEALSPVGDLMEAFPVPNASEHLTNELSGKTQVVIEHAKFLKDRKTDILDWLRHEFGLTNPGQAFDDLFAMSRDGFVAAVRKRLPGRTRLSAAQVAALGAEYDRTLDPARRRHAEAQRLEREIAALVNQAYGLTEDEVALMWRTAPPRMPIAPPFGADARADDAA